METMCQSRTARRQLLLGVAATGLLQAAGCRAAPKTDVASTPPQCGRILYDKRAGDLVVRVLEWTRDNRRQGRVFMASAPRFEVIPSKKIQPDLVFAASTPGDFAAVNGGFYDADGRAMGIVRHAGKTIAEKRRGGGSGIMLQLPDRATLLHRDEVVPTAASEALQSIDRLVVGGVSVVGTKARPAKDARTAVALSRKDVVVIALVADAAEQKVTPIVPGRKRPLRLHTKLTDAATTTGVSLGEFATLLAAEPKAGGLGMESALNLDGGFSTGFFARVGGDEIRVDPFRATINAVKLRAAA